MTPTSRGREELEIRFTQGCYLDSNLYGLYTGQQINSGSEPELRDHLPNSSQPAYVYQQQRKDSLINHFTLLEGNTATSFPTLNN